MERPRSIQERVAAAHAALPRYARARSCAGIARTTYAAGAAPALQMRYVEHLVPPGESRKQIAERVTELALNDFLESMEDPGMLAKRRAGLPLTLSDVLRSALDTVDTIALAPLSNGQPISAALCNSVFNSRTINSTPLLPWVTAEERARADALCVVSTFGMQQVLAPWMAYSCVHMVGAQMRISYRAPTLGIHTFRPRIGELRQVASMGERPGVFDMHWTLRLIEDRMRLPARLLPISRSCWNRVYTTYMPCPFGVDLQRFDRNCPAVEKGRRVFDGSIIKDADLGKVRILFFKTGSAICVGARKPSEMVRAMNKYGGQMHASRRTRPADEEDAAPDDDLD